MKAQRTVPRHVPEECLVDIDIFAPLDSGKDLFAVWHERSNQFNRNLTPLVFSPHNGGHWIVTGGDALEELYADTDRLINSCITIPAREVEGIKIVPGEADGKEHVYTRRAAARAFTPARVKAMRPTIKQLVDDLIAELRPRGRCDFIGEFAARLPMLLFMATMELPREDGPRLREWSDNVARGATHEIRDESLSQLFGYLTDTVNRRYDNRGDDPISRMAGEQYFDATMPREKVLAMSVNVMLGGLDTVASLLGFVTLYLYQNPDLRTRLAQPGALPDALPEMLRRFPVASLARVVAVDFEYAGVTLKAGDHVLLPTACHGLNSEKYEDPLRFNPDRTIDTLMTFGRGRHQCLGQYLAINEAELALTGWLNAISDYRVSVPFEELVVRCGQVNALEALPLEWDA